MVDLEGERGCGFHFASEERSIGLQKAQLSGLRRVQKYGGGKNGGLVYADACYQMCAWNREREWCLGMGDFPFSLPKGFAKYFCNVFILIHYDSSLSGGFTPLLMINKN